MNRFASMLSTVALLGTAANAQCLNPNGGTSAGLTSPDDSLSAVFAMGINFPMAGAATAPYTHCVISSNGVVYLTNGGAATDATASQYGTTTQLQGTAGASPRIAPFWDDLWDAFFPGVAWSVDLDTSVPGRCAITWRDACEFPIDVPALSFQAELFDTGVVTFSYGDFTTSAFANTALVGLSIGNAVADPGASDLSNAPVAATGIAYQLFAPGTFDLANSSISFFPSGQGYAVATTCAIPPASHTAYGDGCYTQGDSFYQLFPEAGSAATALSGQSMVLTPVGSEYLAIWGGGSYVAPTGAATTLTGFQPFGDDGVVTVTLASPMPIPGGVTNSLVVHSNGNVWVADNSAGLLLDYSPDADSFLSAPNTGWWSWHDYDIDEAGSGQIKFEEIGNVSYITWDNVESYPTGVFNPSTLQFQFDRSTGSVTFVWQSIDGNNTSFYGSAHLVGYSPGGLSPDTGSRNLALAGPIVTSPLFLAPLSLTASPTPVSSTGSGTLVSYTTSNMFEFAPSSGLYVGVNILSLGTAPGIDLGFLGAPGCLAHVAGLELTQAMVGSTSTQSVILNLPAGLPAGTVIYSQSACLVLPNSLPNGQNAFGLLTSNGIASLISTF